MKKWILGISFLILLSCERKTEINNSSDSMVESYTKILEVSQKTSEGDIQFIEEKIISQISNFPKCMYVNSKEGLRVHSEPSINSNRIGSYIYGQRVIIHEKSDMPVTIDSITNYWIKVGGSFYTGGGSFSYEGKTYYNGWVFGGYLSEQLPEDAPIVIGYWDNENDNNKCWIFTANNRYIEGVKGSSGRVGAWSLKNNILAIFTEPDVEEDFGELEVEITVIELIINSQNNILLNYQNGEIIKLLRNDKDVLW
jgi:hypothetical protein